MTGREILDWFENNTLEEFEVMGSAYRIKGRGIPIGFANNLVVYTDVSLELINPENPLGFMLIRDLREEYSEVNPTTLRTLMERLELRMKPKCKNRRINDR
jgi:hypothetical protein